MSDKPSFVGVDLGNAYSRAAHSRYSSQQGRYGEAQVVCPAAGRPHVRSIVARNLDDEQEIGDEVFVSGAAAARTETVQTVAKADLVDDGAVRDAVVAILTELRKATERVLGPDGLAAASVVAGVDVVDNAVANEAYCAALLDALSRAGLARAELVPEALAAFAFHRQRGDLPTTPEPGRYLVFNFGADHTDCTVIDVATGQPPTVSATATDKYGGREFDAAIAAWVLRCFSTGSSRTARDPELLLFAETLKQAYSERTKTGKTYVELFCELPDVNTTIRLTQEEFNSPDLTRGLQAECLGAIMNLLREVGVNVNDPVGIILAGGGARWGFVQQQMRDRFPNTRCLLVAEAPEETIVKGLAVVKTIEEPAQVPQVQSNTAAQLEPADKSQFATEGERLGRAETITTVQESKPIKPRTQRSDKPAVRKPPPKRTPSPRTAGNLELLGWLGLLGVGWIYGGRPLRGVFALVSWWALIILGIIGTGALMVTESPWYLAGALATWFAVPLLSRGLVRRHVRHQLPPPPHDHALED